jgi:hypothetical protein
MGRILMALADDDASGGETADPAATNNPMSKE